MFTEINKRNIKMYFLPFFLANLVFYSYLCAVCYNITTCEHEY